MANPFFDAAYYLAKNPDVVAAGYTLATAEQHYNKYGAFEVRAANPWFDARAYLAAYPDLAAHGVTVANALAHYTTYGLNEGRTPAANVNPASFSYANYATANPDLQKAFGITDPAHLTVDQQHQLLGHFLSYGFLENRPGIVSTDVNSFFIQFDHTPPAQSGPPAPPPGMNIIVDGSHVDGIYNGAGGDDIFTSDAFFLNGSTLNGTGGNDTLNVNFLRAGVPSVATVNSIEKINADFGSAPGQQLIVETADTPSLSITVKGGVFFASVLNVISDNAALHTLTVDGSAATALLNLALTDASLTNVDVQLTGGSVSDTLSTSVGVGNKATLNGGAGSDTLNASAGQDIMTGGTGNDIFHFGAGTAAPVNLATATVDTITDFNVGDTLQFGSTSSSSSHYGNAGNNLALVMPGLMGLVGPNISVLFSTGDNTHYFINTGNGITPAAVIKIVLAAGLDWNNVVADTNGAHYVLPPI